MRKRSQINAKCEGVCVRASTSTYLCTKSRQRDFSIYTIAFVANTRVECLGRKRTRKNALESGGLSGTLSWVEGDSTGSSNWIVWRIKVTTGGCTTGTFLTVVPCGGIVSVRSEMSMVHFFFCSHGT